MPVKSGTEDLFPRGHARGQPAVRLAGKSDGPKKRENLKREPERSHHGRLSEGSTVLAIITRCDEGALHLHLPSGASARANPHEIITAEGEHRLVDAVATATSGNQFQTEATPGVPIYKVLRVGQVVRAAVIAPPSNAGTNHVFLSLHPALVNAGLQAAHLLVKGTPVYATVKSVEDHGYVLDFGSVPTRGFLPFDEAGDIGGDPSVETDDGANSEYSDKDSESSSDEDSYSPEHNTLLPGTPVDVVVSQTNLVPGDAQVGPLGAEKKRKKKKRIMSGVVSTVRVSAKSDLVGKAETLMLDGLNIHGLRAGMRLTGKVLSIDSSKAMLTVFGIFSVFVHKAHIPRGPDGTPSVKVGCSVSARLLAVDAGQKIVSASLLPDGDKDFRVRQAPDGRQDGVEVPPGSFFSGKILKVLPGFGLRVGLPWNARPKKHKSTYSGFVHICDVDVDFDNVAKKMCSFIVGEFVQVRVAHVGTMPAGNGQKKASIFLSMRSPDNESNAKDVLITKISNTQVKKGAWVRGFVSKVNMLGALLCIGRGIRARVKRVDMADDFVREPSKAFPIGMLVEGKISEVQGIGTEDAAVGVSLRKDERTSKDSAGIAKYAEGEVVRGTVHRVERFGAIVKLGKGSSGLLHTSEADLNLEFKDPWKEWVTGQTLTAVVIDASQKKRRLGTKRCHFEAAGVHANEIDVILEENARIANGEPCLKKTKLNRSLDTSEIQGGSFFKAKILKVLPGFGLRVALPRTAHPKSCESFLSGFVHICDIDIDFNTVAKKMSKLSAGEFARVRIVPAETPASDSITLSMRSPENELDAKDVLITEISDGQLKEGAQVRGFVSKVNKYGALLWIGRNVRARVKLSDLSDDFVKDPAKSFPIGMLVEGKISELRGIGTDEAAVGVSLRKQVRKSKDAAAIATVTEGEVVRGTVHRVERFGAIVKLAKGSSALLHTSEADQDRQIKDPWKEWVSGQHITSVIIDASEKKRRLGTKRCHFEAAGVDSSEIDSILEENARKGSSEPFLKKPKLNHVRPDIAEGGTTMDAVNTGEEERIGNKSGSESSDAEMEEDSDGNSDSSQEKEGKASGSILNIAHAFSLEEDEEADPMLKTAEEEGLDAEAGSSAKREEGKVEDHSLRKAKSSKEKRDKKRAKEAAENEIRAKEETLAANPDAPETAEDFERMILGEPNSAAIWIRYMAFRLSLAQTDKARAVAERALETIELTKEVERVNLWMAYVNLEANFGGSLGATDSGNTVTKAAAVFRVFDRAVKRVTDVQDFHLQVFESLKESDMKIAEEVMKRALKQFKHGKEVWIAAGRAKFERGDVAGGRKTLERALLCLEKRSHVAVIMKFAQMEYRHGSVERARTVFESVIGNYPKRLDLWSVFLDMETGICKSANERSDERREAVESTRLIFERCASLDLSSKKMKSVFKKWLAFEKHFGGKTSHKAVLAKAKQYVESKSVTVDEQ